MAKLDYEFISSLDPSIRKTVLLLHAYGFKPVDSGGHAQEFKGDHGGGFVSCVIEDHTLNMALEANRVVDILEGHGLKFYTLEGWGELPAIQVTFNPRDGMWFLDIHGIDDTQLRWDDDGEV